MTRNLLGISIVAFFLTQSCGQFSAPGPDLKVNIEEETLNGTNYDKHQWFEDLEYVPLEKYREAISVSNKVIACNWNDGETNPANVNCYAVDAYGIFDNSTGQILELDEEQRLGLISLLTDSTNYDKSDVGGVYFIPHIAFVFYRNDSIVGQSNISFFRFPSLRNVPKNKQTVFSKRGFARIRAFCSSIGLRIIE